MTISRTIGVDDEGTGRAPVLAQAVAAREPARAVPHAGVASVRVHMMSPRTCTTRAAPGGKPSAWRSPC